MLNGCCVPVVNLSIAVNISKTNIITAIPTTNIVPYFEPKQKRKIKTNKMIKIRAITRGKN